MTKKLLSFLLLMAAAVQGVRAQEAKAYAVVSDDGATVTFYYDSDKDVRGGIDRNSSKYPNITKAVFDPSFADYRPDNLGAWFQSCTQLTSIEGMEYLNTSETTYMSNMFFSCESLTTIDLSHFDTSKVTIFNGMFYGCSALTSLDLSHFNTSSATDITYMFRGCSSLTSLDLSSFNTSKVTSMPYLFWECKALTSVDLSSFDTSNATDLGAMFYECSALTSVDLSSFDTRKVTNIGSMFRNCTNLKTIYVSDLWSTENITSGTAAFFYCSSLVGGQGTTYNSSHVDHTYAHVDGGSANPGYLTLKPLVENIAGNQVGDAYWATYYNSKVGSVADASTTVYTAELNSEKTSMALTEVVDKVIPAGNAVILKSSIPTIALTHNAATGTLANNSLLGVDEEQATTGLAPYTLAAEGGTLGFYHYTGSTLAAHKAYLDLSGSGARVIPFSNAETTGISAAKAADGQQVYYNLNGQRVEQPQRGLYIVNGKKVIKK